MTDYRQMLLTGLEQNPQELARLKKSNELTEFLETMVGIYEDQEQLIIHQMSENLPDEALERTRALNMAREVAEEVTAHDLTEFLANQQTTEYKVKSRKESSTMRALKRVPKIIGKEKSSLKEKGNRIAEILISNLNRNVLKDAALRKKK